MSKPDLEALVTPRIAEAFQAAIEKIGRDEFKTIMGLDDQQLASIFSPNEDYVAVAEVTLACQINKSHNDPNPAHTSVTECLRGTTIRMPRGRGQAQPTVQQSQRRARLPNLYAEPRISRRRETRPFRLLGFSVNTITFLILGYFLGGALLSPILFGQPSCIGVSLNPCPGGIIGIIFGAVGGLGYTYYYFVKRV